MHQHLVSIIIPVYNAEKNIKKCLESIMAQTYDNIEIILVDDGSIDNSLQICKFFANKDKRIKIVEQKINAGPSAARNLGLENASGKYIQFVDSDDTIDKYMVESLVNSLDGESDLVFCGYKLVQKVGKKLLISDIIPGFEGKYDRVSFLKKFGNLFYKSLINSPCNKLYIKKIIDNNNIKFKKDVKMGEDLLFNIEYLQHCNYITVINTSLYNYLNYNDQSLTKSYMSNLFENQKYLYDSVKRFLLENNIYIENNKYFVEKKEVNSIVECLKNVVHKNSNLSFKNAKLEISKIVCDIRVKEMVPYFKQGNIEKKIIGYLIKRNCINCMYFYLRIREFTKYRFSPIFMFFKKTQKDINA